jgi:hypothetical protein
MNKMFAFIRSQYKRMINLLFYIVIIGRDRPLPMLQQSRIIGNGTHTGHHRIPNEMMLLSHHFHD